MQLLRRIFAGPEQVSSVIDGAKSAIDAGIFTNQERAEADAGLRGFLLEFMKATQPQNLARRYIAFAIVALFVLLVLLAVAVWPFLPDYAAFIFDVIDKLVWIPFSGIMGFYFLTHLTRSYRKPPKE